MMWQWAAPGIILILVKFTGMFLFLIFIPQIFPRGNISFIPEKNFTVLQTTQILPEVTSTVSPRAGIKTTFKAPVSRPVPRWEGFRGSEYWFSEVPDVWFNSQMECIEWNSNLVTINDKAELEFIVNKATAADYFIGLTYSENNKKWRWTDGTEPSWNLFTKKQKEMGQDCATIRARDVHPASCYKESRWICEKQIS
ncbi:C-type lectin domain family 5 member A-like [Varanus komodoensis]|uniref:C-type lectin domain family 5 member A-like n=1 Tax=Varanus komodoensis TaxID=61221 RepID=UPI001CF77E24|nr:C-type lectin domain family 5 member A-like [Varanus komodoensis]XP_044274868.1 C-type lectin domain family 5 member A-like [Varanus komodoensis]XP_044274869.1 C-type lectin domain family 5 member A-like [Varanus komodoensis]